MVDEFPETHVVEVVADEEADANSQNVADEEADANSQNVADEEADDQTASEKSNRLQGISSEARPQHARVLTTLSTGASITSENDTPESD